MTANRLSHPLLRHTVITDEDLAFCDGIATQLANENTTSLAATTGAVIRYADRVYEQTHPLSPRTEEWLVMERLALVKALTLRLQAVRYRSPHQTPRDLLELDNLLHRLPKYLGLPSTLQWIGRNYQAPITLYHLTRLLPVLDEYRGSPADARRLHRHHREIVRTTFAVVVDEAMTPKKLEGYLRKALQQPRQRIAE